jgi:DNA polymerase
MRLTIDFETRSSADLKKVGVWKYCEAQDFDVLCLAVAVDDQAPALWAPAWARDKWPEVSAELCRLDDATLAGLVSRASSIEAHNAEFEIAVWASYMVSLGFPEIPPEKWRCSAAKAAMCGLPRSLGKACEALGLAEGKDADGSSVMRRMCRPKRGAWCESPESYRALLLYCAQDVIAERELSKALPDLPEAELAVWRLTVEMNRRGLLVDVPACQAIIAALEARRAELDARTSELTAGRVASVRQVAALVSYLREQGVDIASLDRAAVRDCLARRDALPDDVVELLSIRREAGKSSVAKFDAMVARACSDGRVRGNLVYHGAATGRWAGAGIQPQNLPRKSTPDVEVALRAFRDFPQALPMLYGAPLADIASGCLRAMIIAAPGMEFVCADFSAIEARVLAVLAGEQELVRGFANGVDIYCQLAARIYGRPVTKADKQERQMGKQAILGLGYGMGAEKFRATCADVGIDVDEDMAQHVVGLYRETYQQIVAFWKGLEKAAKTALLQGYGQYRGISYLAEGRWLTCTLPSGRRLYYLNAALRKKTWPDGGTSLSIVYQAPSQSGSLEEYQLYGGLLAENVVQAVARDLLADAMLRAEQAGMRVVVSVHDEILVEAEEGRWKAEDLEQLMSTTPDWAPGWPISAEGWVGKRYRK